MFLDDVRAATAKRRLYHQQLSKRTRALFDPDGSVEAAVRLLDQAVAYEITNVEQHLLQQEIPKHAGESLRDLLPIVAPPADVAWFEFREQKDHELTFNGVLLLANRLPDGSWHCSARCMQDSKSMRVILVHQYAMDYEVRPDGYLSSGITVRTPPGASVPIEMLDNYITHWGPVLQTVLYAIAFTHCRNVEERQHRPDEGVQRHRRVLGQQPAVSYKTLVIDPDRIGARYAEHAGDEGERARRRHSVAGHFTRYGPEAPLFGRLVGTFWIPRHERGDPTLGIVEKRYEVEAPGEQYGRVARRDNPHQV